MLVEKFGLALIDEFSFLDEIYEDAPCCFVDHLLAQVALDSLIIMRETPEVPDWATVLNCADAVEIDKHSDWHVYRIRGSEGAAVYTHRRVVQNSRALP